MSETPIHPSLRRFLLCGLMLLINPGMVHAAPPVPAKDAPAAAAENTPKDAAKPETKPAAKDKAGDQTKAADMQTTATDETDVASAEKAESDAAVALPVNPEPVRIYGWREFVRINGIKEKLMAKLDTGALTSSIHAEEKELFERDGKKWVRFIVTDPAQEKPVRSRIEAPLVRVARIKEPNSDSVVREVVRLSFQIGERKMSGEFTLNNRSNMLAPVLLGRRILKDLGWVDSARTYLADQRIFR